MWAAGAGGDPRVPISAAAYGFLALVTYLQD
jgi:hypothetical protein